MQLSEKDRVFFGQQLMDWHEASNTRQLPWKHEKDPYRIWLSEVILQQTRALQGLPYYIAFTTRYPNIFHLAEANDEDVFRLWQGLGYYNRCKNMLATARAIVNDLGGVFPASYEGLLQLKGIGPYTAAAISSFAFELPQAVVDGNVYRVIARYVGVEEAIDTTAGKQLFVSLAQQLFRAEASSSYNQAIMDLGATVCTPRRPQCTDCPLQKRCIATRDNLTELLPIKSKKVSVQTRYFNYFVFRCDDAIWIRKRSAEDIWQNLFEPYLAETATSVAPTVIAEHQNIPSFILKSKGLRYCGSSKQRLTHRVIEAQFFELITNEPDVPPANDGMWVPVTQLKDYSFPKTVLQWLERNGYIKN
jgi:A/G-specific adenine glycosylase